MALAVIADFANVVQGGLSISPEAAITASANGSGIDMQLSDGPVHLIAQAGATDFTSGDETYSWKLQESADNSTNWTDLVSSNGTSSVSTTAANTAVYLSINTRLKRYVRAVCTIAGTTPSIVPAAFVFANKKIVGSGSGNALTSTPGAGF